MFEEYERLKKTNDQLKVDLIEQQQDNQRKDLKVASLEEKIFLLNGQIQNAEEDSQHSQNQILKRKKEIEQLNELVESLKKQI